jgi:hypothetical protein
MAAKARELPDEKKQNALPGVNCLDPHIRDGFLNSNFTATA